jgi:hypothetical protein
VGQRIDPGFPSVATAPNCTERRSALGRPPSADCAVPSSACDPACQAGITPTTELRLHVLLHSYTHAGGGHTLPPPQASQSRPHLHLHASLHSSKHAIMHSLPLPHLQRQVQCLGALAPYRQQEEPQRQVLAITAITGVTSYAQPLHKDQVSYCACRRGYPVHSSHALRCPPPPESPTIAPTLSQP